MQIHLFKNTAKNYAKNTKICKKNANNAKIAKKQMQKNTKNC